MASVSVEELKERGNNTIGGGELFVLHFAMQYDCGTPK
jgi:hypothetical protein